MNRQAIVGLFAILGILGLFVIFYVLSDFGVRARGYSIGVLFKSATGLRPGGIVYESGVSVGTVERIILERDFTVDVIVAIRPDVSIPANARYTIDQPLTGDPTLHINPPTPALATERGTATSAPSENAILPRRVLPLADQPRGETPIAISDLLQQGVGEFQRVDKLLGELQAREPKLLATLQGTLDNANALTANGNAEFSRLSSRIDALADSMQTALTGSSANVLDLTQRLDSTVAQNQGQITTLLSSFNQTARTLGATVDSLHTLAADPTMRGEVMTTTHNIAAMTTTFARIARDLRSVTGNPATRAQLRDTVANIDATTQKANSLLGQLGGTSSVYGVDTGATPPPQNYSNAGEPSRPDTSFSGGTASPAPLAANLRGRLNSLTKNLFATQIRVSGLTAYHNDANNSPLLSHDQGPQSDFNVIALPNGRQSLLFGANDIGTSYTSYNLLLRKSPIAGVQIGAGVFYSRLGLLYSDDRRKLGYEVRAYDLRRPTLDLYGHFNATPTLQLFGGERDTLYSGRRAVFGIQSIF